MRTNTASVAWIGLVAVIVYPAFAKTDPPRLNTAKIEELTGAKGTLSEKEGVFKVSVPRKDLQVIHDGVHITPPMGITSWAAFKATDHGTVVMGDLVLEEEQVDDVMRVALDNDLEVTALHNHFLSESPKLMFMHVSGKGNEAKLATAVGRTFMSIQKTSKEGVPPIIEIEPAKTTLDPKAIEAVLGTAGDLKGGVYKVVVGRTTEVDGHEMGNAMGVNTWAAFAGSDERAVVDGDFAMLESELQGVLRALRHGNISVAAIHQHMTGETPRIVFLHYWAIGPTSELAKTLRSALDLTGYRPAK